MTKPMANKTEYLIQPADVFPVACAATQNKVVNTATKVACGWAGSVIKKVFQALGQEQ